jgi:PAS domain S-box-containing protein
MSSPPFSPLEKPSVSWSRGWRHSFQFRGALVFLALLLVMGAAIALVVQRVAGSLLLDLSYKLASRTGEELVAELGLDATRAEALARSLAVAGAKLPKQSELFESFLPAILEDGNANSLVAGGGIWPEPRRFDPDRERRSFFWGREPDGKLRYYEDYNDPSGPGYHGEEWYVPVRHLQPGEVYWSKSYMDPYSREPMVTCSAPIFEKGEFAGVATVDLRLMGLKDFFEREASVMGGYAYALDRNNRFLSFPQKSLIVASANYAGKTTVEDYIRASELAAKLPAFEPVSQALAEANEELLETGQALDQNRFEELARTIDAQSYQIEPDEARLIVASMLAPRDAEEENAAVEEAGGSDYLLQRLSLEKDPVLGQPAMASIFQMPSTRWKIVLVSPLGTIVAAADRATRQVIVDMLFIALACVSGAFFYTRYSLFRPLSKMTAQLRQMAQAEGDGEYRPLPENRLDELGELAQWFNRRSDALRQSAERLEVTEFADKIINGIQDPIFVKDRQHTWVLLNDAFCGLMGRPRDELVGKTDYDFFPKEQADVFWAKDDEVFKKGFDINEEKVTWKDGVRDISTHKTTFNDSMTGEKYLVGTIRDISERKKAEEEVRQKARELAELNDSLERRVRERTEELEVSRDEARAASIAKSQFLANMSHEIRTPLNGVIGMTSLLRDTPLNAEQTEYAKTIRHSGEALLSLINDILDFSKIEAGALEFETVEFNLVDCVEDVGDLLAHKAREKGLELLIHFKPGVPAHVIGDPSRLRQVMLNLAGNAVKFTEEGEVVVRVENLGAAPREKGERAKLRFSVRDTGVGIPLDRMDRLFKTFSQVDASTTRRFGGTGLGLAISKKIVDAMGGEISVQSVEGEGSEFWFVVELEYAGAGAAVIAATKSRASGIRGLRVLVVDDNEVNRTIFREQLQSWGCYVEEAMSASEAVELLREAAKRAVPFQLALVDHQMPEADGCDLARAIKADPILASTTLVLASSAPQTGDRAQMTSLGFGAVLSKPVRQSHLYDTLAGLMSGGPRLSSRSIERELRASVETSPALSPTDTGVFKKRSRYRILLAEDNPINQQVAARMLQRAGYACDLAGNGLEALEAVERVGYDLVLMDCQMPEMDGFAAAREIRRRESASGSQRRLAIVAATADALKGDRERCLAAGMDDYIAKPIRDRELYRLLEERLPEKPGEAQPLSKPASSASKPELDALLPESGAAPQDARISSSESAEAAVSSTSKEAPAASGDAQIMSFSLGESAVSSSEAASAPMTPPVDFSFLMETAGGDAEFATQLASMFLADQREQAERLEHLARAASPDPGAVRHEAHGIKGAAASVGAKALSEAALELEKAARAGERAKFPALARRVREESDRAAAAMAEQFPQAVAPTQQ